ncbi:MAG: hypothetical protein ACLQRH_20470 [Acidimicrobiales bacterium]
MEPADTSKVDEVLLADHWLKVKEGSFRTYIHGAIRTPTSDREEPLEWYSFEDIEGKKHNGLKSWIQNFRFRD